MTEISDRKLAVLRAVHTLEHRNRIHGAVRAVDVADLLKVPGARRLGRGAVKGSWSGTMSPALRVAPTLAALRRDGLLFEITRSPQATYLPTFAGLDLLAKTAARHVEIDWSL